jgi:hypothetical protein
MVPECTTDSTLPNLFVFAQGFLIVSRYKFLIIFVQGFLPVLLAKE